MDDARNYGEVQDIFGQCERFWKGSPIEKMIEKSICPVRMIHYLCD